MDAQPVSRMDAPTDGPSDGDRDGGPDGWQIRRTDKRMDGQTGGRTNGQSPGQGAGSPADRHAGQRPAGRSGGRARGRAVGGTLAARLAGGRAGRRPPGRMGCRTPDDTGMEQGRTVVPPGYCTLGHADWERATAAAALTPEARPGTHGDQQRAAFSRTGQQWSHPERLCRRKHTRCKGAARRD
jgi:hypothetical protein